MGLKCNKRDIEGFFFEIDEEEGRGKIFEFAPRSEEIGKNVESRMECNDERCYVYHLFVTKKYRKCGIGTEVVNAAEEKARELNAKYINVSIGFNMDELNFLEASEMIKTFFTKLGYEEGHHGNEELPFRNGYYLFGYRKKMDET